jgi:hypothetical protein
LEKKFHLEKQFDKIFLFMFNLVLKANSSFFLNEKLKFENNDKK